jgi:hypothetical protein
MYGSINDVTTHFFDQPLHRQRTLANGRDRRHLYAGPNGPNLTLRENSSGTVSANTSPTHPRSGRRHQCRRLRQQSRTTPDPNHSGLKCPDPVTRDAQYLSVCMECNGIRTNPILRASLAHVARRRGDGSRVPSSLRRSDESSSVVADLGRSQPRTLAQTNRHPA